MIVSAARKALMSSQAIYIEISPYIDNIRFIFLPKKKLLHTETNTADSIEKWYENCVKDGMTDIKMLSPIKTDDRHLLGFVNTNRSSIVVFHSESKITYWIAEWNFDSDKKKWNVVYIEQEWIEAPNGKPRFEDNSDNFRQILYDIAAFADEIDFSGFGDIFRSAICIIDGNEEIPQTDQYGHKILLPQISEANKKIYYACSKADVFGAMGSWNDSPPYYAHEKGLSDKYNQLSDELLRQIRLALLYVINEN